MARNGIDNALMGLGAGLQGRGIEWHQVQREQQKRSALADLAQRQAMGQITPQQYLAELSGIDPEVGMKIQLQQQGVGAPAAIQVADAIRRARDAGDTQRLNDIVMSGKLLAPGVNLDESGVAQPLLGYGSALGVNAYGEKRGSQQGVKDVDLQMNPPIEEETKAAGQRGAAMGEKQSMLKDLRSTYPEVVELSDELKDLSGKMTYTQGGKILDSAGRQLGFEPRDSAIARAEYINKVQTNLFPILRQTFGAQFTQAEGEKLLTTLGDPDTTPSERNAQIDAFIKQKYDQIKSTARYVGESPGVNTPAKKLVTEMTDEELLELLK